MNPIRALHDWSRKRKVALELLDTLRRKGRPGGVDVSRSDPEFAAALMWLLLNNNEVTVVKNRDRATLMYKADVDAVFTPGVHAAMARGSVIVRPGEDLFDERPDEAE
jgi:hypothetical protein